MRHPLSTSSVTSIVGAGRVRGRRNSVGARLEPGIHTVSNRDPESALADWGSAGQTRVSVGQPAKFVLVGVGGFVVNLLAFGVVFGSGSPYLPASVAAYFAANVLMYLGNRYYTFGLSHEGVVAAYFRHVLVGAVVAGFTAALLTALVEGLGLDPRPAQALALAVATPLAFVLTRRWTFRLRAV